MKSQNAIGGFSKMKDLTELVIIIDRSGSMHDLKQDVIGGYNTLIEEQKKIGKTLVTTVFFNHEIKFIHEGADIKDIKPIDGRSYQPSGCTALLDAIGDAIGYIKAKHAKLTEEELPENTIVSIMTDGLENASKEYSYSQIKRMIELQKKCGWTFIFQAANIDVEYESSRLGIDRDKTMKFTACSKGVHDQMRYCCNMVTKIKTSPKKKK